MFHRSRFISTPPVPRLGCWCACPSRHQLVSRKNFPKRQKLRHHSKLRKTVRRPTLFFETELFSLGNPWVAQRIFTTYVFNLNRDKSTLVLSVGVSFLALLVVAISIVPVLLTAYFINTFQIGNNPNPTKHHAIRNHKHGGNHGSPAQSDRSIYPHNQPRRTEALGEQLFPRLRMTCDGRSSSPLSLKTPGPHLSRGDTRWR